MLKLNYGTDPEVFVGISNNNTNYVISPALLEERGTIKPLQDDIKHPIYISYNDFSWMMDGVAFELTLKRPISNYLDFYKVVHNALDALETFVSNLKFDGESLKLFTLPIINIKKELYDLKNEKIYQGFIFGCDKDYDAVDTEYDCITIDVKNHPLRYAGGHLHVSGSNKLFDLCRPAVILQAITTGNFVTANSVYPELDKQRILTYGRPFRYRPQVYKDGSKGVEYRTPSNSWLSYPIEKIEELFFWVNKGVELLDDEEIGVPVYKEFKEPTIEAITTFNQDLSKQILEEIRSA